MTTPLVVVVVGVALADAFPPLPALMVLVVLSFSVVDESRGLTSVDEEADVNGDDELSVGMTLGEEAATGEFSVLDDNADSDNVDAVTNEANDAEEVEDEA